MLVFQAIKKALRGILSGAVVFFALSNPLSATEFSTLGYLGEVARLAMPFSANQEKVAVADVPDRARHVVSASRVKVSLKTRVENNPEEEDAGEVSSYEKSICMLFLEESICDLLLKEKRSYAFAIPLPEHASSVKNTEGKVRKSVLLSDFSSVTRPFVRTAGIFKGGVERVLRPPSLSISWAHYARTRLSFFRPLKNYVTLFYVKEKKLQNFLYHLNSPAVLAYGRFRISAGPGLGCCRYRDNRAKSLEARTAGDRRSPLYITGDSGRISGSDSARA